MACVFYHGNACTEVADPGCQAWGVGDGLCTNHIAAVRQAMQQKGDRWHTAAQPAVLDQTYINDYVKLYALMLDKRRCQALITDLNQEIVDGAMNRAFDAQIVDQKTARTPNDQQYVRLSRVLEHYEGRCWFPTTHRLYTGGLTSENYQASIALGYMPKDAGAGPDHGEYSHRLQWHIIMRVVTDGFKVPFVQNVWSHSPLELFTFLGTRDCMDRGLWGLIFDNQDGKRYDNPGILNQEICGQFTSSSYTGANIEATFRNSIKAVSYNASRRTAKRQAIVAAANDIRKRLRDARQIPDTITLALDFEQNLVGLLERWKKLGGPTFFDTAQVSNPTQNRAYNKIAREVWSTLDLKTKKGLYVQDPGEQNALLLKGEQPMTKALIVQRREQSRRCLNPHYIYNSRIGAYKAIPAADNALL